MNANEPAFPMGTLTPTEITTKSFPMGMAVMQSMDMQKFGGLTKREMFAAMAMQSILSNHNLLRDYDNRIQENNERCSMQEKVARQAMSYANALLAALSKVETKGTTTSKGDVEK